MREPVETAVRRGGGLGFREESSDPPDILLRLCCHLLVQRLPERGLPELIEALREMVEYHSRPPAPPPAEPAPVSLPGALGETRERPVFPIEFAE